MDKREMTMGAGEFKAKCLQLLDEVAETHKGIVVTKRGKPVARVVAVTPRTGKPLRGSVLAQTDLVAPIGDRWFANDE